MSKLNFNQFFLKIVIAFCLTIFTLVFSPNLFSQSLSLQEPSFQKSQFPEKTDYWGNVSSSMYTVTLNGQSLLFISYGLPGSVYVSTDSGKTFHFAFGLSSTPEVGMPFDGIRAMFTIGNQLYIVDDYQLIELVKNDDPQSYSGIYKLKRLTKPNPRDNPTFKFDSLMNAVGYKNKIYLGYYTTGLYVYNIDDQSLKSLSSSDSTNSLVHSMSINNLNVFNHLLYVSSKQGLYISDLNSNDEQFTVVKDTTGNSISPTFVLNDKFIFDQCIPDIYGDGCGVDRTPFLSYQDGNFMRISGLDTIDSTDNFVEFDANGKKNIYYLSTFGLDNQGLYLSIDNTQSFSKVKDSEGILTKESGRYSHMVYFADKIFFSYNAYNGGIDYVYMYDTETKKISVVAQQNHTKDSAIWGYELAATKDNLIISNGQNGLKLFKNLNNKLVEVPNFKFPLIPGCVFDRLTFVKSQGNSIFADYDQKRDSQPDNKAICSGDSIPTLYNLAN